MIELEHVHKVAGQPPRAVLDVEALAVRPGETTAVIGPPDSGRAELLALLTGQSRPTAGTVRVAGLDPFHDRTRLSGQVGVLFASNTLYERLSVRANLSFHCRLRSLPPARADEVLGEVGLADHAAVQAGRLPPGLARRLAFGRAILHRPVVLLLEELFAGCDVASCSLLTRRVRELAAGGATALILTGDATGLAALCQATYGLEQGRLVHIAAGPTGQDDRQDLPLKIPARQEGQVVLLNTADILYASAEEGRTCLHTAAGPVSTHLSLAELEPRLAHRGFFRAHRGYLVNLQRVKAIAPYTRDSFTLVLDDPAGTEIPLSKSAARDLRELLGY